MPNKNRGVWLGHVYAKAHKLSKENEKYEKEVREINKKFVLLPEKNYKQFF